VSVEPEPEYLTTRQVAARLGIKPDSVRQALWRGLLPEPDLILLGRNLWLIDTIDRWRSKKHIPRKKRERVRRSERLRKTATTKLPRKLKLSPEGAAPGAPLVETTVSVETAAHIAAALRNDGHHCITRDVQELAVADPAGLDYDRRKLQQRVQRKLREIAKRSPGGGALPSGLPPTLRP
jgi:hypothetical protein